MQLARNRPEFLDRVIEVISHLVQDLFKGLHMPEPLRGELSGMWSVRLSLKDRLVYKAEDGQLLNLSVEGHYDDR